MITTHEGVTYSLAETLKQHHPPMPPKKNEMLKNHRSTKQLPNPEGMI
jgi:hypothetical protein